MKKRNETMGYFQEMNIDGAEGDYLKSIQKQILSLLVQYKERTAKVFHEELAVAGGGVNARK